MVINDAMWTVNQAHRSTTHITLKDRIAETLRAGPLHIYVRDPISGPDGIISIIS